MSSVSVMDIFSLIAGTGDVGALAERACNIWRAIANAKDYGKDVALMLMKLQMEYYRFQAWWTALQCTVTGTTEGKGEKASSNRIIMLHTEGAGDGDLQRHLRDTRSLTVPKVVSAFVTGLEEMEAMLKKSGCLSIILESAQQPQIATTVGKTAMGLDTVQQASSQRLRQSRDLLRGTPFLKRFAHKTKPWARSDSDRFNENIELLKGCNDFLYGILPQRLRNSLLEQSLSGLMLGEDDVVDRLPLVLEASRDIYRPTFQSADLSIRRQATKKANMSTETRMEVEHMQLPAIDFTAPFQPSSKWSIEEHFPQGGASNYSRVLIEWYPYPYSTELAPPDTIAKADVRFGRLAYLLSASRKPSSLCTLDAKGFVNDSVSGRFGLVYDIPTGMLTTHNPVSLYQLLDRLRDHERFRLPTLQQRYHIAASLAGSIYTLMISRWHHKRFSSRNIAFVYKSISPRSLDNQLSLPDLELPFIGGFSVSRSNEAQTASVETAVSREERKYLHPSYRPYRTWGESGEKFRRAFDIYAFGLLLVEIGWWNVLKKIPIAASGGEEFRRLLMIKCRDDLAC